MFGSIDDYDNALIKEITYFIRAGLLAGQAAIVIATKPHRDALEQQLTAGGYDLAAYQRRGQYVPLDAAATLSNFMVNDWPNEQRFHEVVGEFSRQGGRRHLWVRAFGEMVAVLWAEGKREAALHLENSGMASVKGIRSHCIVPTRQTLLTQRPPTLDSRTFAWNTCMFCFLIAKATVLVSDHTDSACCPANMAAEKAEPLDIGHARVHIRDSPPALSFYTVIHCPKRFERVSLLPEKQGSRTT